MLPPGELIEAACAVRQRAYAPYSKFLVGAALWGKSGRVYVGCNVENASYGLTSCAERIALGTAVAHGEREITAVAIATSNGSPPCGACRQLLAEFCADLPVFLVAAERGNEVAVTSLAKLLPARFDL